MATKIAISIHKGGTGKTCTAMALASALARAGKTCLLVDLDPQGHCALGLGVDLNPQQPTIRDLFADPPKPISELIRSTMVPGLSILPSDIRLARVAQALYMRPKREELLRRSFVPVEKNFDFIVMDCPPSLGVLTEMGIDAADLILVPCQLEARATDALVDLLDVITLIKGDHFEGWRILLTRVNAAKSRTNEAVRAALGQWENKILEISIPQSEALNQAQIARTDIFSFDPKCKGALAYERLALDLLHAQA